MKQFYVIESIDTMGQDSRNDRIVISTEPARTNMSDEVRIEGWCGTIDDVATYARGEYDSIEDARAFIKSHYPEGVREMDDFDDEGGTVVASFLVGRYEQLDQDATSEYVWDELEARVTAQSTDQEIEAICADLETAARSDGFALADVGQLAKDFRWTKRQLGA